MGELDGLKCEWSFQEHEVLQLRAFNFHCSVFNQAPSILDTRCSDFHRRKLDTTYLNGILNQLCRVMEVLVMKSATESERVRM